MITNISTSDQEISIELDQESASYSCDEIFGPYLRHELPFEYVDGSLIPNSEKVSNSWFIENPINRDLVKSVTYKIPAETEKEFIIVLKSPLDKPQFSLASFLTLSLANQERKRKVHIEKLLKAGADLEDIEIET
jgi:hypothetical protein